MFRSFVEGFRQGYNTNNSVPKSTPTKPAVAAKPKPKRNAKVEAPKVESKRKFKKRYIVLGFFVSLLAVGALMPEPTPEEIKEMQAIEQRNEATIAEIAKQRIVSTCQSQLERSMRVETRMQLRDPSSFEDRGTIWLPKKTKDGYVAIMTYGARNGFGGMNTGYVEVDAVISEQECALKTIDFVTR